MSRFNPSASPEPARDGWPIEALADAGVMQPPLTAESLRRHVWLRWLREMLCGAEGSVRACRIVVAGFCIGQFMFFFDPIRMAWVGLLGAAAFLFVDWGKVWRSVRLDPLRLVALHFLSWMTVRSLLGYGMVDGASGLVASSWLLGTLLLAIFGVLVWHAAENAPELEAVGIVTGYTAAVTALLSLVLFYLVLPGHVFGERLMNFFVYGGWNPVSTGLTLGFAALWMECLRERARTRRERVWMTAAILVLLLAVCFTRSRGALLALLAGHVALTAVRGMRRTWVSWGLLGVSVLLFALSGPVVAKVAEWQTQSRAEASAGVIAEQPMAELVRRGDAGRFDLYERALQGFTTPARWIFGIGQWGPEEACCRSLSKLQYHLHSGFFATFVHGGLIGFALLMGVFVIGGRRALLLARRGQDIWLVLLAYGCAGLLFDGQTMVSLTSMPQMETLLFAFPLTAAAAVWWHGRTREA